MYIDLHVKCLLFLSDFKETLIFSTHLSKNIQISNLIKIVAVEAEFCEEEQTDVLKDVQT
jgi:hypothetical protein